MQWLSPFSNLLPMTIAVAAGASVPFQAASNAALGHALGHPLWATLSSLVVSVLVVVPLMMLMRVPTPAFEAAVQGPAWLWLGGVIGVAYLTAALILTPKLGAASFVVSVIAGQMLASMLIDRYGLMGLVPKPVGGWRVVGIALILLGMVFVQINGSPAGPASGPASSSGQS